MSWGALTVTAGTVEGEEVLVASVSAVEETLLVVAKLIVEVAAVSLIMMICVEGEAEDAEAEEEEEEDVYVEEAAATEADAALAAAAAEMAAIVSFEYGAPARPASDTLG